MESPTSPNTVSTYVDRFNTWLQESVMIKLFSIGFLILILMLPASWIEDLVRERQSRATEVLGEVSDKWSGAQTLSGPVLVIPFIKEIVVDRGKDGIEILQENHKAYFLSEDLNINGQVDPMKLNRGIFDVSVYKSAMNLKATFVKPDFSTMKIKPELVQWKDAYVIFGLSDLRGISENPTITIGADTLVADPSNDIGITVKSKTGIYWHESLREEHYTEVTSTKGMTAQLNWNSEGDFSGDFLMKLNLKGSRRLDFVPAGKTTTVALRAPWADPSFSGEFLPIKRDINEQGFTAEWSVLHFNRPFSQSWVTDNQTLSGADFGVKLLVPVDQYQKAMRTSKYSVLIILLTFIALFLVEITQKIRIHPFQYILIGAALIIYYTLLLSISEHTGFNIAYGVSAIATVVLIALYSRTFLHTPKLVALVTTLLVLFYGFIYLIILQQDFSLLIGSVGLFIIVGMLMYFSRKIRWYDSKAQTQISNP